MLSMLKRIIETVIPSFMLPFVMTVVNVTKLHLTKRYIKHLLKNQREIFLEFGSGNKKGAGGWVTIDLESDCDIYWDLRKGMPFPDASIAKLYSSHFLEHLTFKEGQQFLDECLRVLTPGGTFSICVPNARLYFEAYQKPEPLIDSRFFGHKPAYNNTTIIDFINYTAYMDGHHKYMFDEENLIYILESKGFRNVRLRQFESSLDLEARDFESIYAVAEK
jgi:predicted SAM-dependent methyltransferase